MKTFGGICKEKKRAVLKKSGGVNVQGFRQMQN